MFEKPQLGKNRGLDCGICQEVDHSRVWKLLQQGISVPEYYGDLVYRIRKTVRKSNFSEQFIKLIKRYQKI